MRRPEIHCTKWGNSFGTFCACSLIPTFVFVLFYYSIAFSSVALASTVLPERQNELEYLLQQDCGSCHGLTLNGGLGSPLTTMALTGKSPQYLFAVIREGIPDTPMPAWSAMLDDDEIRWLVKRLLTGAVQP